MSPYVRDLLSLMHRVGFADLRSYSRRDVVAECYAKGWIEPKTQRRGSYRLTRLGWRTLRAEQAAQKVGAPAPKVATSIEQAPRPHVFRFTDDPRASRDRGSPGLVLSR